jgi:hypothetical protein
MTSREVYQFLETNSVKALYDKYTNVFNMIDKWEEIFIRGDLLNEYELSLVVDQATGCYGKLSHVLNGLESYFERKVNNTEAKHYKSLEAVRAQDTSVAKSFARDSVSDIRDYVGDFKSYLDTAQQMIVSAQSRMKRLTVEKGGHGVDYTGETSQPAVIKRQEEQKKDVSWNE